MTLRMTAFALLLPLIACGDNSARFLITAGPAETGAKVTKLRVAVRTVEVRDVSLPAYAAASEIILEGEDGSLRTVPKAIWADDPVRGVTGALSRSLDARSTATVAAEPWPLAEPADVRLEVRVDRMVAKVAGRFELTGQYAIASPMGMIRESVHRFVISAPLADDTPGSIAAATGAAIDDLAGKIVADLRR